MTAATQREEPAERESAPPREPTLEEAPSAWQRATYRWTAITTVMAALLVLYTQHPYYGNAQFGPWRAAYPAAFVLWLCFGLFYCKKTLERFSARRYVMRDGGLHLLLIAKRGFVDVLPSWQWRAVGLFGVVAAFLGVMRTTAGKASAWRGNGAGAALYVCAAIAILLVARCLRPRSVARLAKNPRIRTTILGIAVKGFFTPLMTGFVVGHINTVARMLLTHKHLPPFDFRPPAGANALQQVSLWWHQVGSRLGDLIPSGADLSGLVAVSSWTRGDVSWGLDVAYNLVFMIDCGWALAGYASESRSRS